MISRPTVSHFVCEPRSFLVLALWLTLSVSAVSAQEAPGSESAPPSVSLPAEQFRNFADAVRSLAQQGHVTFVAEGVPLHPTLPESGTADQQGQRLPVHRGTLTQVATAVADAYDYEITRTGRIYLLRKRYGDPDDLPGVTLEEAELALQDMDHVTASLNPRMSDQPDRIIGELVASLTSDQLQTLNRKGLGNLAPPGTLRVADLSADQQTLVWRMALYFAVQRPMENAGFIRADIQRLVQSDATFGWGSVRGLRLFGYNETYLPHTAPIFRSLSNPGRATSLPGGGIVTFERLDGSPLPPVTDPTDPLPVAKNAVPAAPGGTTLGRVVKDLNARPSPHVKMVVDDALQAKPVTIVEAEAAPPEAVLSALASVYGLRVEVEGDGTRRLTRPLFRVATAVAGVKDAVQHTFPEPFLRAIHSSELASAGDPGAAQTKGALTAEQILRLAPQIRNAAVRRLRTEIEPKLKTAPRNLVPLSQLSDTAHMAFADALMADCFQDLQKLLSHPTPDYITRFDQLLLIGGAGRRLSDGASMFALGFALPSPDGAGIEPGPGVGAVLSRSH